ncbi:putative reverse transcriptase domain-containing protein [Tanacetum coccineum]
MAAPVIPISSYSSKESVGSHASRVILFGTIPTSIPVIPVVPAEVPIAPADTLVAPEVGAVSIISPTGVLDLVDYSSSSYSDPSEDSLPIAPKLPLVSPFLCSDDSEADSKSEPAKQRPERRESLIPSSEFSLAPVVAPPTIYFTSDSSSSSSSSDSSSDISSGSSSDSLSDSSSVHSSGCDASSHEAFMRWRSAPLSTLYPPTTSESSLGSSSKRLLDSSLPSARPSRKRCRSIATLVPSSTSVSRLIALALVDFSPCKRFKDSYSSEARREEHMEIGTADVKTIADLGISDGVRAPTEDGLGMGVEVATSGIREDEEEFEVEASTGGTMEIVVDPFVTSGISEPTGGDAPNLEGTLYDISHYMSEVPLDRIIEFETAQRQLEAGQLVASGERVGLANKVRSLGWENLRVRDLLCIERDRVNSLRHYMALSQEEFLQIRKDRDDTRRILRRLESLVERLLGFHHYFRNSQAIRNIGLGNGNDEGGNRNGNGNKNGGGNGNRNHNENDRDARPVVRECTYQDFMKCQPLNFKGTKGVVGLIRTIGTDAAFAMSWRELMKLMAEVYCPRTKIQKMESEMWNLTEKNNDLATYTQRFQGNVIVAEPTRLQDVVRMANNLMDQKLKGYAMKNAENKRKFDNSQKDNCRQQPSFKRQNVGGPCIVRCGKCNKVGHLTRDCKATISTTSNQRGQNRGNKTGNKIGIGEARGKAYVLGGGDANPDSNVVTGTILLNSHYASVLFDSGADRSFVSTTFSTLLNIILDTLDVSYAVELADGRVSETNIVLRGCTKD